MIARIIAWGPLLVLGLVLEFLGSEIKDYAKKQIQPPDEDEEDDDPE